MNGIEMISQLRRGESPKAPIACLLGIELVEIDNGRAVMTIEVSEQHHNPMGTLHGGVMCDVSDLAMGHAMATTLVEDELFTTVEIKLNFLKPIWQGKLRAVGTVMKRGTSTALLSCQIYDNKDSLVAYATSTCMVIKGSTDGKREEKG